MRIAALILAGVIPCAPAPAAQTPRPSPELTLQRVDAPPLQLSQFRGKVVALAFIHTTCSHCQDLTRILKVIQKDYAARNVQVVVCPFEDEAKEHFPAFLQTYKPNFPAGYGTGRSVREYLNYDDVRDGPLMVPYMIFIDKGGIIRGDFNGRDGFFVEGEKHIRAQLDKMTTRAGKK